MEIAALASALSGIKNAAEIARLIKDSGASLEAAEMKLKLADLIESLTEAKMEVVNIQDVVLEKDKEIRKLKERLDISRRAVWEEPFYFLHSDEGKKDGPYCQRCYDSRRALIRLVSPGKNGYWECLECRSGYKDDTYDHSSGIVSVSRKGGIDWDAY